MADIKIANLTATTSLTDSDLFVAEDNADTKKITKENLRNTLGINEKANKTQEAWIEPTLLNGWVNATSYVASYMKDDLGGVNLRGQIKDGTITDGTNLFTLPVGYRPLYSTQIPIMFANGSGKVMTSLVIGTTGACQIYGVTSNVAIYLHGIRFII